MSIGSATLISVEVGVGLVVWDNRREGQGG
jgi:hypothetical protein